MGNPKTEREKRRRQRRRAEKVGLLGPRVRTKAQGGAKPCQCGQFEAMPETGLCPVCTFGTVDVLDECVPVGGAR